MRRLLMVLFAGVLGVAGVLLVLAWRLWPPMPLTTVTGDFTRITLTPDGKYLWLDRGTKLRLLDTSTGQELACFDDEDEPFRRLDHVLSPTGDRLLLKHQHGTTVRLLDTATFAEIAQFEEDDLPVLSVRTPFSPDGRLFVIELADGTCQVVDARTGKPVGPHFNNNFYCFSGDSRLLAVEVRVMDDSHVQVWDLQTWQLKVQLPTGVATPQSIGPDGLTLVTRVLGADTVRMQLWDLATRKVRAETDVPYNLYPFKVVYSSDGAWVSLHGPGYLTVWEVATGRPFKTAGLLPRPDDVRFSSDSRSLALLADTIVNSVSLPSVHIYDLATGTETHAWPAANASSPPMTRRFSSSIPTALWRAYTA